jgi:hypothetical protein
MLSMQHSNEKITAGILHPLPLKEKGNHGEEA